MPVEVYPHHYIVKLGSYSGANNARDFERSMKLPVVGSLKFKGVEFRGTY